MNNILENLSGKEYQFKWQDNFHQTDVKIKLPNLLNKKFSMYGDWGPMFSIEIEPTDQLAVSYNGESYNLEQKVLKIESPMVAEERKIYPLFIVVTDDIKGMCFRVFLKKDLSFGKVEVKRIEDDVKLYQAVNEDAHA
jgi:hypothetical protein